MEGTFTCGSYSRVEGIFTCGSYSRVEGLTDGFLVTCGGDIHVWDLLMCGRGIHVWDLLTCGTSHQSEILHSLIFFLSFFFVFLLF